MAAAEVFLLYSEASANELYDYKQKILSNNLAFVRRELYSRQNYCKTKMY